MAVKPKRPLTNAERQARYREKHVESVEGDKERAQFIFEIGTKKRLERIARHYGLSATVLIQQWAAQVASEVAEKEEQKAKKALTTRYKHNA
jgi:hypothetical protein